MDDSLNICLACGICCQGTVIGFVKLEDDEISRLKGILEVEDENGHGFFLQPCNKYCDGCTIYADRPKQCASYNCNLLKSVEKNELDFDVAVEIVKEVKQKKAVIEDKIAKLEFELHSESFYFKMVELKKVFQKMKAESALTQEHLELTSDVEKLDALLLKRFGLSAF